MSAPLLIQEPPLQLLRSLAKEIGLNEAIVIQQVHYRQQREGGGWLRCTYAEWRRDFPFWGVRTIERIFNRLRDRGLLDVETGSGTDRALRYRVRYEAIPSRQLGDMDHVNVARQSDDMGIERVQDKERGESTPIELFEDSAGRVRAHLVAIAGRLHITAPSRAAVLAVMQAFPQLDYDIVLSDLDYYADHGRGRKPIKSLAGTFRTFAKRAEADRTRNMRVSPEASVQSAGRWDPGELDEGELGPEHEEPDDGDREPAGRAGHA